MEGRFETFFDGTAGIDEVFFFRRRRDAIDDVTGVFVMVRDDKGAEERSEVL